MSGGSWDYVTYRVEEVADRLLESAQPERVALGRLLKPIATALHDIEWVDSGDYARGDELPAIRAALGPHADALMLDAAAERLRAEVARAQALLSSVPVSSLAGPHAE